MLKGHTKIELTDVNTGEVQTVEHDNMITNAVRDLLTPIGGFGTGYDILKASARTFVENLFGTVALFEKPQEETADNYLLPSDNIIRGYADDRAYAGVVTQKGSRNTIETGIQEDGSFKFVWDFSTSQANGTISSLSLMPLKAGYNGLAATDFDSTIDQQNTIFRCDRWIGDHYNKNCIYTKNGTAYFVDYQNLYLSSDTLSMKNNNKLILHKGYLPIGKAPINSYCYQATINETLEIDMPTAFVEQFGTTNNYFINCRCDNGILTLFPSSGLAYLRNLFVRSANSQCIIVTVDLENDFKVTSKTITNTTGGAILNSNIGTESWTISGSNSSSSNSSSSFIVTSKYVICWVQVNSTTNNRKLFVMDVDDNTNIKEVTFTDGTTFQQKIDSLGLTWNYGMYNSWIIFNEHIITGYMGNSGMTYVKTLVDLKSGTASIINIYNNYNNSSTSSTSSRNNFPMAETEIPCVYIGSSSSNSNSSSSNITGYAQFVLPWICCTKNNLSTPVIKTASQSMKVTYTISETSGV